MKILYLLRQFPGVTRTDRIILNLTKMMQRCGHRVKIFTHSSCPPSFYDRRMGALAIKEFVHEGVPILAFRYRNTTEDNHFGFEQTHLQEVSDDLVRRENPDVLHGGDCTRLWEFLESGKQMGIPYVITVDRLFLNPTQRGTVRDLLVHLLTHAQAVVAPTFSLADMFQKEFRELKIKLIRYGLSRDRLAPKVQQYTGGEQVVFGYARSFDSEKGHQILLDAFSSVISPNVSLKTCSEQFTDEIAQGIDVLVAPSMEHEDPLLLDEALAFNIPVIAPDVAGVTDVIRDNVNGFIFRKADVTHLAEILQRVADTPEVLNRLKDNIGRMVFPTVEQEAYAYERLYKQT